MVLESRVCCDWFGISGHDIGDHRSDSESLLDGCAHGVCGGYVGVFLQQGFLGAVTVGGSAVVVFEVGEANTEYGREI